MMGIGQQSKGSTFAALDAFLAVAQEHSFRRGASRLGLMPSTVSHMLRDLESQLGVRLLQRTTRSVSLTEVGERLFAELEPTFSHIERALSGLSDIRGRPSGTVRLNVPRMAAAMVLAPAFGSFASKYPEVTLEVAVDDGFVDIVERRFDAGIRLKDHVGNDMVAVRVTPDLRIAVVGAPDYFAARPPPESPKELANHLCIGYRQVASGALYRWEFERSGESLEISVRGPLVLDDAELMTRAALDGAGLAYATESMVRDHIAAGRLVRVLEEWCPPFDGFFLYYPSRRNVAAPLRALINHLQRSS
jgi:DNA-binding transcriptional LysR family regulator